MLIPCNRFPTFIVKGKNVDEMAEDCTIRYCITWTLCFFKTMLMLLEQSWSFTNFFLRSKNTVNILIKNMLDAFLGGVSYWAIGWGLAFGKGGFLDNTFCLILMHTFKAHSPPPLFRWQPVLWWV